MRGSPGTRLACPTAVSRGRVPGSSRESRSSAKTKPMTTRSRCPRWFPRHNRPVRAPSPARRRSGPTSQNLADVVERAGQARALAGDDEGTLDEDRMFGKSVEQLVVGCLREPELGVERLALADRGTHLDTGGG